MFYLLIIKINWSLANLDLVTYFCIIRHLHCDYIQLYSFLEKILHKPYTTVEIFFICSNPCKNCFIRDSFIKYSGFLPSFFFVLSSFLSVWGKEYAIVMKSMLPDSTRQSTLQLGKEYASRNPAISYIL